ncbi:MAG: P1 family peptidase, partial [Clostridiales bacterium]|nr:P1 family peptidase [Clostridiales bacterium]
IMGANGACKSGIGAATCLFGDVFVTAVIAVNALGDVVDHNTGKILAGARLPNGEYLNTLQALTNGKLKQIMKMQSGTNTTIGCVMTNAQLDKVGVNKLAAVAHDGLAMSIRPVHTDADGDTLFALSKGDKTADINIVMALAVEATARAVENAVKL